MGIKASEQQAQQEAVIETYDFVIINTHYRYTSYYQEQTIDGNLYEAEAIERGGDLALDGSLDVMALEVILPSDNILAGILQSVKDTRLVSLTIKKYFADDLVENFTVFSGDLKKVGFEDGQCLLSFESIMSVLDSEIPKVVMQSVCNNTLFDSVCLLSSVLWRTDAVVTVTNGGRTVSSVSFGAKPDGYFKGGQMYFPTTGEYRYITKHVGNDLTMHYSLEGLHDGATVHTWPGCDKRPQTCNGTFVNIAQFVGMPYLPTKDTRNAITN